MGVMNKSLTVIFVLLSTFSFAGKGASLDEIKELKWNNRVVLVWSNDSVEDIKAIFNANQYEIDDRDIIWFITQLSGSVLNDRQIVL